jgi:BMFP domain-containing protein YqiC
VFERLLEARFDVVEREEFPSSTRMLYHATPRRTP